VIRRATAAVTVSALVAALLLSAVWLVVSPTRNTVLEPVVNVLVVLAALSGIFAERWAAARQRRAEALRALADELRRDADVLGGPEFTGGGHPAGPTVYPRLPVSAVDTALVSGALDPGRDAALLPFLHRWRDAAAGFNRRLDLTESLLFGAGSAADQERLRAALHQSGGYLDRLRRDLADLTAQVTPHP
jgi:hypothetical protein